LVSQVLTLFTTPVTYLVFDRLAARFRGRNAEGSEDGPLLDNPT
jgi:multidrug efflux pump